MPLTLVAAAVLLLVQVYTAWVDHTDAHRRVAEKATLIANLVEEHARLMFHNARLAAETTAQEFREMDSAAPATRADWLRLRALTQAMPGLNRIVLFDAKGNLRLESRDFPTSAINVFDRPYFQAHRAAERPFLDVGRPIVSRISPDQIFPVSRRLETPAGGFNGVVSLGMQVKLFEDFYANLGIGSQGNLTLLRVDGVILAREPRPEGALGQKVDLESLFPGFESGRRDGLMIGRSPVDGVERVFAYRTLEDFGVVLVAGVALADVMEPWHGATLATALTAGPALLLLVLMTLAFRRSMHRLQATVIEREEAMRQRDLANADLQRFAEISAHHFQEPARRLVSYAGLLHKRLSGDAADPETARCLDHIHEQAAQLRALVRDVQLYLTAGHSSAVAAWTDAREAAEAAEQRLSAAMAAAGATVTVGDLPAVPLDRKRLTDALVLLLDNALTYASTDCQPEITITGDRDASRIRLSVADNGPGVPASHRDRVFRVFERLDVRPTSGHVRTGIGLAIVRRIMTAVGGSARMDEAPGGGAVVHLDFSPGEH